MMDEKQIPNLGSLRKGIKLVQPLTLSASGTLTLDLKKGTVGIFDITVATGVNITGIEIINVPSTAPLAGETLSSEVSFMAYITRMGALGTFAWGALETWRPSAPSYGLSSTAGRTDSFVFQSLNGGTSWFIYQGAVSYD